MVTAAVSANADGLDDVIDASALSSIQDVINSSTDEIVPITVGNGTVTKTVVEATQCFLLLCRLRTANLSLGIQVCPI